jgi:hypothetical protein
MANQEANNAVEVTERDSLGRKKSFGHTGPKSPAGKNRAKLNALKHARNAKSKILPYEDIDQYEELVQDLYQDINPQGAIEADLVNQYVDSRWRSRRMEERIRIEQESIFERVDKVKIAAMLELDEMFFDHLPDYFLNMSKRFGPKQIEVADIAWRQYCRMVKDYDSGEFTNLEEMRIHFDILFEEFEKWVPKQKGLPPLLSPQRNQFNPAWIEEEAEFLFSVVQDFAIEMYFQANFMGWKEQIRNWLQIWYLMQKRELQEIDQYDLVLIKETHMQHAIIERLVKIQKYKRDALLSLQKHYQQLGEGDEK